MRITQASAAKYFDRQNKEECDIFCHKNTPPVLLQVTPESQINKNQANYCPILTFYSQEL
jgi:hypothetical protein